MEKDLKTKSSEGHVTITFKKVNGEIRTATGTRILKPHIAMGFTDADMPKGTGKEIPGVVAFWDIDKGAWRSVREDSIISIDDVTVEGELFGDILFDDEIKECMNCEDCVCADTCPDCNY